MQPQVLGLYCEPLRDFREKLDQLIRNLMLNMTERDLEIGTVTAKIKITRRTAADGTGVTRTMIEMDPEVSIKIGASGKAKCSKADGLLLAYGEDGEPVIGENQITIDEYIRNREDRSA